MGMLLISVVFMVIGFILSRRLQAKFAKYSQVPTSSGKSGAEIAAMMLKHYGVHDVQIVMGQGTLTDHYNPQTKTVALSPEVYSGRHVAAAAVAAHECGHAVQHAESYSFLQMRSALVPVVQISSTIQQYLFMFGLAGLSMMKSPIIMYIVLAAFGMTALFSLITLPVEFDASRRALVWLNASNVTRGEEHEGAKDALWWAAMTYVSAALAALVQFFYLLLSMMGRRD